MGVQLVPYMTAVVAVHALLLSLGGLLVVNTLRVLTTIEQEKYENAPKWIKELVSLGGKKTEFRMVEGEIPRAMKLNVLVGSLGILYSLAAIAFLADISQSQVLIAFSLILVIIQLIIFFDIVSQSMNYLGWWVMK